MSNPRYVAGRAFEYRTRVKLLSRGAVYVMRAASSKGAADLIALWPKLPVADIVTADWFIQETLVASRVWLVQCKRDGKLPKLERIVLKQLAEKTGATPVLAKTGPNGRGVKFVLLNEQEC